MNVPIGHGHIIEETLGGGGTVRKKTSELALTGLSQGVRAGVPENLFSLGVLKWHIRDGTITLERATKIPEFLVHLRDNDASTQFLGDVLQKLSGGGLEGLRGDIGGVAVTKFDGDIDVVVGLVLELFQILLPQFLEEVVTFDDKIGKTVAWLVY